MRYVSREHTVSLGEHGVRTRVWRNGLLKTEDFPFEQIADYLAEPDCLVWVDVCAPDAARLDALAGELSLDPHAVEDAVARHERPKATRYSTHLFLSGYALQFDRATASLIAHQISAFELPNAVVTVRQSDDFDMEGVVSAWDQAADLVKFGPRALVYGLLDVIVDGHFGAIEAIDDEIEGIEGVLFEETPDSVRQVQRRSFAELTPYYDDLCDHVLRASEWSESLRDMLTSIFETNLSLADARLNTIMKLRAWAAIIAVRTAITGFYGQNVRYPGVGTYWGFWSSLAIMFAIAVGLCVVFRRKDWI